MITTLRNSLFRPYSYQRRYELYAAYCLLVGSPVRNFEWWLRHADNLDLIRAERVREFEDQVA